MANESAALKGDCNDHVRKPRACEFDRGPTAALATAACAAGRSVGTAVRNDALANDTTYAALLASQFTYVTPENETKWGSLQPVDSRSWDFTQADAIVAAARQAHQAVKGHTLIWHNQLPNFVNDSLSADELKEIIHRHIHRTVNHFERDHVRAWDVVNEAFADDGTLRDSVFSRAFGDDFIADAFRMANSADHDAELIYNDYGIETINAKSNAVYDLLSKLRRKHVPVDAIGFQMHVDARFAPSVADLTANFQRFADLGLDLNISEMDVRVANLPGASRVEKLAIQQQIYHRVVAACMAVPRCRQITTWGFSDRYSWVDSTFGADDPLIFDDNYARKPAYYGMVDAFVGLPPDAPGLAPNLVANGSFESGTDGFSGMGISGTVLTSSAHSGKQAGLGTGRTATWQGPAIDLTALVIPGWEYDVSLFTSIANAASDAVAASLKISCAGQADQFIRVASGTATAGAWSELSGRVIVPFCTLNSATLYVEGPAAGVDVLIDDVKVRPRGEPLGNNIVANGTFETGVSGWGGFGAVTLSASTAQAHGGTQSALVSGRTANWQGPLYNLLPVATKGATYRIGAFVRVEGSSSEPARLTVKSVCNGTQTFTPVASGTATNTGWLELSGSYLVQNCPLSELSLYAEGPAAGVNIYIDDVSVQQRISVPIVPAPQGFNLLGNGGLELGADGWGAFGGTFVRSSTKFHSGAFAAQGTGRTATWQGPSVQLPTGAGTYEVSAFALQDSAAAQGVILSASLTCNGAQTFPTIATATPAGGAWVEMSGSLTVPAGCTTVQLYLQQNGGSTFPDLYLDDVVVKAVNVPNLIGNFGLELGTNSWGAFGATFARTTDFAHSGTYSGVSSGRTATWQGPSCFLPTGAGRYNIGIFAFQNSGAPLNTLLSAKLDCNGAQTFPTLASSTLQSGAWGEITASLDVPAGCKAVQLYLQQNGGSAFPNLYVDDIRVSAVPQ
ncbi:MAG: endo-1,4-beta-xylanase [Myxococcota bacterium]